MTPEQRPVRVLYLYVPAYLNPPWTVCAQIIATLPRARVRPAVAVDWRAAELGVAGDVPVTRRALDGGPLRLALALARVSALVRRERIDLLHANDDLPSALLGAAAAKATGRKLVLHFHSRLDREDGERFGAARLALLRQAARAAALCVGCSRYQAGEVRRLLGVTRVAAVLNGVDVQRFHPGLERRPLREEYGVRDDEVLVLQLARLQRAKRQEDLVRAMALARARAPQLKALLVGWPDPRYAGRFGSYQEELRHLIAAEGLTERVILAPARPEAPLLHAASDVGVLPSSREPFGLVLPEAMACARPVVGAESGGIPEIVEHGRSGLLVPLGSPPALADALVALANDPALRARLGAGARRRAEGVLAASLMGGHFAALYEAVHRGEEVPEALRV